MLLLGWGVICPRSLFELYLMTISLGLVALQRSSGKSVITKDLTPWGVLKLIMPWGRSVLRSDLAPRVQDDGVRLSFPGLRIRTGGRGVCLHGDV